jgi:hypothetical protein
LHQSGYFRRRVEMHRSTTVRRAQNSGWWHFGSGIKRFPEGGKAPDGIQTPGPPEPTPLRGGLGPSHCQFVGQRTTVMPLGRIADQLEKHLPIFFEGKSQLPSLLQVERDGFT